MLQGYAPLSLIEPFVHLLKALRHNLLALLRNPRPSDMRPLRRGIATSPRDVLLQGPRRVAVAAKAPPLRIGLLAIAAHERELLLPALTGGLPRRRH